MLYGQELLDSLTERLEATKRARAERSRRLSDQEMDLGDCFVSTYCNSMTQRELEMKITILENKGLAEFPALFTLDGELVSDNLRETKYGYAFLTTDGKWINPDVKESTLTKKGLKTGTVQKPAWVTMRGEGTGLSGLASSYLAVFPSNRNYWTGKP